MKLLAPWLLISTLYALGVVLLIWSLFIFVYQYIAALSMASEVLHAFTNPRILSALWISITSSIATALLSILFGVPLGYIFGLKEFKGKSLLQTLTIDVPQTFPPIAEGIILMLMLGPDSPIHVDLSYTYAALVLSKLFVSAPFIITFAARKFKEVHESGLDITAKTLGANELQVFWTILLPLALKDIIAGTSLCWARAMGELGGSIVFAGIIPYKTEDIPTFIATNSSATGPALAATILATTASLIAIISFKAIAPKGIAWKAFF
jgi:ABC-type sulfate transport system permease component